MICSPKGGRGNREESDLVFPGDSRAFAGFASPLRDGLLRDLSQANRRSCRYTLGQNQENPPPWTSFHDIMNHLDPPHLPVDLCWRLHVAALLLLPTMAQTHSHATGRSGGQDSTPYLLAVGHSPLRFRDEELPSALPKRPPAGAPPAPNERANATSADSGKSPDVIPAPADAAAVLSPSPGLPPEAGRPNAPPASQPPAPSAIIPDDSRPVVRPEDFLPFFQLPGSTGSPGGFTVIAPVPASAPAPAALPPSSASFTQSPR